MLSAEHSKLFALHRPRD